MKKVLTYKPSTVSPRRATELRSEIETFHAEYCSALDSNEIERWPDFFCDDAIYRVTSRENALLDMPVGLIYSEGIDMIRDRAMAVAHSQMYAPRHLLHVLGIARVTEESNELILAETPFMLLQTLVEGPSTVHLVGRYYDRFVRKENSLFLSRRDVVYDTEVLATSLAYPV